MDKVLGKCTLAHSIRYLPYREGTAVSFLRGGQDTHCQGLIICVWPSRARHKYFRKSHLMEAERKGIRTLWESLSATVEKAGYTGVEETFDEVSMYGILHQLVVCLAILTSFKCHRRRQNKVRNVGALRYRP